MAFDLQFDPVSRDLVDDGNGSFAFTDTAATMVMHQYWCRYRKWWGLSELGSLFYDLGSFQQNPALKARDEVQRMLGVVVSRGRISNVSVAASAPSPGRVQTQASMRDVGTGQVINQFVTPGGK